MLPNTLNVNDTRYMIVKRFRPDGKFNTLLSESSGEEVCEAYRADKLLRDPNTGWYYLVKEIKDAEIIETELIENETPFEFPSGMMEKLLANTFAGDGTKHPDEHLRYLDDICGLFKLAGIPDDVVKKKAFPLSLKGKSIGMV